MRIRDCSSDVCSADVGGGGGGEFGGAGHGGGPLGWLATCGVASRGGRKCPSRLGKMARNCSSGRSGPRSRAARRCHGSSAVVSGALPRPRGGRSEERRGGKEGVSTCRSRGSPSH